MNPFRHFKTLANRELVELVPETDITGSGATLCVLGLCHTLPAKYYENLVYEKKAQSTLVVIGPQKIPCYRIIWEMLAGRQLSILLLQSLTPEKPDIRFVGTALDKLAVTQKAACILFSTARKALIAQASTWGANPFQVWLKKEYAF